MTLWDAASPCEEARNTKTILMQWELKFVDLADGQCTSKLVPTAQSNDWRQVQLWWDMMSTATILLNALVSIW
jgi:hypothetical protein